ncbi:LAME_0D09450g1_1 [Lachancea meyersii CBS 8951]|uniref:LAME_0D09450g1_1 n=1 Tax=Lachancea meyersii CBS 8951 TaxID=1266667 RepID=A0A1G4JBD7_9SACH|nr:LAME_0D09450g1_1 [Lachancea meyersii CBS 8951]
MKFGKTFPNHQVPEWSHQYVNYKNLKKHIKEISIAQQELHKQRSCHTDILAKSRINSDAAEILLEEPEVKKRLATFFFALDRDIEKVSEFYNTQFLEYDRRLRRLLSSAQLTSLNAIARETQDKSISHPETGALSSDITEDYAEILGILVELRSDFRNLKWYAELNKRAFAKILKKLDKKVGTKHQQAYLQHRILPLGISNDAEISKELGLINETLDLISPPFSNLQDSEMDSDDAQLPLKDSSSPMNVVAQLIEKDDGRSVVTELVSMYRSVVFIPKRTLIALLNKAALSQSFECIDEILKIIPTLGDHSDISGRNFFHHHVIALGKGVKQQRGENLPNFVPEVSGMDFKDSKSFDELCNVEPATLPEKSSRLVGAYGPDGVNSNDSPVSLLYVLNRLPPHLRSSLLQRDAYKRTPLHYSAQYGLFEVSKLIIESLREWGAWDPAVPIDSKEVWGDGEGFTPLHLAVIGLHPRTVSSLTSYGNASTKFESQRLLHLATKLNSPELLKALLSVPGFSVNYADPDTCETALYIAAKLNLTKALEFLLKNAADTEIGERNFGWTPIFVAATEGFYDVAKMLADYGANYSKFDESGWTPMEHAVLRGHLDVADVLKIEDQVVTRPKLSPQFSQNNESVSEKKSSCTTNTEVRPPPEPLPKNLYQHSSGSESFIAGGSDSNIKNSSRHHLLKNSVSGEPKALGTKSLRQTSPQLKSFGHTHLQEDQSIVLVLLGPKESSVAVSFNKVPLSKVSSTELDTALSLVITCPDDLKNTPAVLDLPLDDTLDPVHFTVPFKEDSSHTLFFDIVPTYSYHATKIMNHSTEVKRRPSPPSSESLSGLGETAGTRPSSASVLKRPESHKSKVLGRAVALLDKGVMSVGPNRSSLSDTRTIPIIECETLEVLGTIKYEFMIVKPFIHPNIKLTRGETFWKSLVSTRVIGHRGLGKNMNTNRSLQLGENTVESFIAAASLGASYIEFDVQLTKDDVPVIYHDFIVAESGVDIPMHALTSEQFLDLNNADRHRKSLDTNFNGRSMDDTDAALVQRAYSVKSETRPGIGKIAASEKSPLAKLYEDRMRLTRTFKKNNFKGNARGHSIASSFVTLKELFKKIPSNVGFNVECKYPMLDEAIEDDIGHITVELNHWCDTVLGTVYDNVNGRDIIFSSFHPDVCIMLSLKQPSFPILYLTEGGTKKTVDARAASLQNAIRFAKTWDLLGIVSAAKPIIKAPRLAQVIKSNGLVCVTYGVDNNDPEVAQIEMDAGVDAVIVDSVLAVRRGLTKSANVQSLSAYRT